MHSSAAVGLLLAALCAVTGGACLLRARGAGGMQRSTAWSEALMGWGMAVMALAGSLPAAAVPPFVLASLFGVVAVWELRLLRTRLRERGERPARGSAHHLHHMTGALAMIYMALAAPGAQAGGGHAHAASGANLAATPLLSGVLLAYFAAYVLRTGLRLLPGPPGLALPAGTAAGRGQHPPSCAAHGAGELAGACRVAMGTGMLAMLLLM
ncbi:hypothetical protein H181DRAFT_00359 [Streptomyces sp. WMMB 714]|uniref:DUF5134 domain-containing protein n=1 Tax=Streptomyces sp. WMMB 714 TaxID=1286822 RepID=UPI0005F8210A|nr:DUF5134 domain-containing protein [Streptomyces sp. WMMB 714]SCK08311.1 hypothetical protein H181DRAFT_00359 [Streptomyces sp. WMMB 714]